MNDLRWFLETMRCAREGMPKEHWPCVGTCAHCHLGNLRLTREPVTLDEYHDPRYYFLCPSCAKSNDDWLIRVRRAAELDRQRKEKYEQDQLRRKLREEARRVEEMKRLREVEVSTRFFRGRREWWQT